MSDFVPLKDYAKYMGIFPGDTVFISSDSRKMILDHLRHKEKPNLNDFIDGIIDAVGDEGTVIFPTYNWDFCGGTTFDINNSPCKTGSLGTIALKRGDFIRTKHPIYSFAVSGYHADLLSDMDNRDSFGMDSPFAFFKENNATNYIIDVSLQHCFTFVHFVEEQSGKVNHRYIKNFTAGYIDQSGSKSTQTYSMFVRDLDLDVETAIDSIEPDFIPIEHDLIKSGVEEIISINSSKIKRISLAGAYDIILKDIVENKSRKLCTFKGQEG